MKSLSVIIPGLLICFLLSSCTPVPIIIPRFPEEEAFQDKELQFLKPGETTLPEIKEQLWEPLAIRKNGRILLYTGHNTRFAAWVGTGLMELRDEAFLFIEMNEDNKLKRYEVLRKHQGFFLDKMNDCTSWGLCLDIEMLQFQSLESLVDDATYIFFSPQIELSELEQPPDGQCQIITYVDNKSELKIFPVQIDENPRRTINKKGFLKSIVGPGDHTLSVNWPRWAEEIYKEYSDPIQQVFFCNSGESFFVSVFGTPAKFMFRAPKLNMKLESTDEGFKTVRERRLIID
jgi:hypothetical protein